MKIKDKFLFFLSKKTLSEEDLKQIEKLLNLASKFYYNDQDVVDDATYDKLEERFWNRGQHGQKPVGTKVEKTKKKIKLPYFMGSLDKRKPDSLNNWMKKFGGPKVISHKLDGVSALYFNKNNLLYLATRGDGTVGEDITDLVYELGLPKIENGIAVRGELIINKNGFKGFEDKFSNARSMVSGLVNRKDTFAKDLLQKVDFVAHDLMNPRLKPSVALKRLKTMGFRVVKHTVEENINTDYMVKLSQEAFKNSKYLIDGLVIEQDLKYPIERGNPQHKIAFKDIRNFGASGDDYLNVAKATVKKVEWRLSLRDEKTLKPTVHFEPVTILGNVIKKATGHNAKFIKDNGIGPGAIVKVGKSSAAPFIIESIKKVPPQIPDGNWVGLEIEAKTKKNNNKEVSVRQLEYFFKKIGVKGGGIAFYSNLYDMGLDNPQKIIEISIESLTKGKNGVVVTKNRAMSFKDELQKALNTVDLPNLMVASNLFEKGLSVKTFEVITDRYELTDLVKLKPETAIIKLSLIKGITVEKAKKFLNSLGAFIQFTNEINFKIKKKKVGKLSGTEFVFTGFRPNQEEYKKMSDLGARESNNITKNSILVTKTDSSSKLTKAKNVGARILTYNEFVRFISGYYDL
jgi:NAD-dependent DNA ligase